MCCGKHPAARQRGYYTMSATGLARSTDRHDATNYTSTAVPVPAERTAEEPAARIRKIALVAHDYTVPDCRGFYDYSEHFARINRMCDDQGCDTILYALFTWDSASPVARTHASVFGGLEHVQRVLVEVGEPTDSFDHVEVWQRGQKEPLVARQRFATSSSPTGDKQRFLDDLPARKIADALVVLCGESNIVSLKRASKTIEDGFGFSARLRELKTRVILNPIHDYMTRYEMREKRRYCSLEGRTVLSVWNRGRGKESWLPWTVFHDGEEWTERVREIEAPFADRPDIRIGLVQLADL
jgi:hypothetical protein